MTGRDGGVFTGGVDFVMEYLSGGELFEQIRQVRSENCVSSA